MPALRHAARTPCRASRGNRTTPDINASSVDAFRPCALAARFDPVAERQWAPNTALATCPYPSAVELVVTRGQRWPSHDGQTRHLPPGDRFAPARVVSHDERHGPEGATCWVARRSAD